MFSVRTGRVCQECGPVRGHAQDRLGGEAKDHTEMSSEVQKKRPRREVWPKRPSAGQTSGSLAIRKTVRGLCGDAVRIFMNNSRKHIYSMRCAVDPYLPTGPLSSLSLAPPFPPLPRPPPSVSRSSRRCRSMVQLRFVSKCIHIGPYRPAS
jgi:hypothetical protein